MEEEIAFLLSRLCLAQKKFLWEQGLKNNLSPTQIEILISASSHKKPVTISQIAKELNISTPTISDSVNALEKKGMLTKTPLSDRRKTGIKITPKGKKVITKPYKDNPITELINKSISPKNQKTLIKQLLNLVLSLKNSGHLQLVRICPFCGNLLYDNKKHQYLCSITNAPLKPDNFQINCRYFNEKE